jgi:hypothetical protein
MMINTGIIFTISSRNATPNNISTKLGLSVDKVVKAESLKDNINPNRKVIMQLIINTNNKSAHVSFSNMSIFSRKKYIKQTGI